MEVFGVRFACRGYVVLVWLVDVAWFFASVGWSGFAVCWWFRAVFFCSCTSRLLALPDVSLNWDIRIFCFHLHH